MSNEKPDGLSEGGEFLTLDGEVHRLCKFHVREIRDAALECREQLDPLTKIKPHLKGLSSENSKYLLMDASKRSRELTVALAIRLRIQRNKSLDKKRQQSHVILSDNQYELLEQYDFDCEEWCASPDGLAFALWLAIRKACPLERIKQWFGSHEVDYEAIKSAADKLLEIMNDPANPRADPPTAAEAPG